MNKLLPSLASLCALGLMIGLPAHAQSAAPTTSTVTSPADDSLFRALGSEAGIARIVGEFVPRLVSDPRTSEFFKKTSQDHLKRMLAQQFCAVSDGGCVYAGLPMKTAHHDMDISRSDFNALVEVLQDSMDAQGVPFSTQNRLLARLAPMHRDIINVH